MGANPSSQKKKKKKVKKPKNIGNSFQVNISLITKQNKTKKAQICLPQQIPNSLYKNQKTKTLKKNNGNFVLLLSCAISIFACLYSIVLHTCQNPIALLSH